MNDINKTIDRIVLITYISLFVIYENISVLNFYNLKILEMSNVIYIFTSNIIFILISIFILLKNKKKIIQNVINLLFLVSVFIDFMIYIKSSKLYPYSIYLIILLIIVKIIIVIFGLAETITSKKKLRRDKKAYDGYEI